MAANFPLAVTLSIVDKATAPIRAFAASFNKSMAPIKGIKNHLKLTAADIGLPKLGKSFTAVGTATEGVLKKFKSFSKELMIVGGLVTGFMGGLVYTTANAGDVAYKTAQKVGVSTEAWTKMAHAASMSGVSSEEMKRGLNELNDITLKAAQGNQQARNRFAALGLSIRDASGKLKPANVLFEEAADRIASIEDPARRTQAAGVLLGKELGPQLVPLLAAGREGLRSYYKEAERLGKVITDEKGQAAASFNDSLARTKDAIKGLTYAIGFQLLPIFEPWIQYIEQLITANKDLITSTVAEWIGKIRTGFNDLRPRLLEIWNGIKSLAMWVNSLVQSLGGWGEVLPYIAAAIAAIKLTSLILSVVALGKAVVGLGIALLTTPVGWVILGIAALVAGFVYLWRNCEGFRKFWIAMWDKVKNYALGMFDRIRNAFKSGFIEGMLTILWEFNPLKIFTAALSAVINYIGTLDLGFGDLVTRIGKAFLQFHPLNWMMKAFAPLKEYLSKVSLAAFGFDIIDSLWTGLKNAWNKIVEWDESHRKAMKAFWSNINLFDSGYALLNSLWDGIKAVWGDITAWFGGLEDQIKGLVPQSLLDMAGTVAGGVQSMASTVGGWFGYGENSEPEQLLGPPAGTEQYAAKNTVVRNEEIRDARVVIELPNLPQGAKVTTRGTAATDVRHKTSSAYLGPVMGAFGG